MMKKKKNRFLPPLKLRKGMSSKSLICNTITKDSHALIAVDPKSEK